MMHAESLPLLDTGLRLARLSDRDRTDRKRNGLSVSSVTDDEPSDTVWRGDHTFSAEAAAYSLENFIIPEVKTSHPDWTTDQVREESVRRYGERLRQDYSYEKTEQRHEDSVVSWVVIETESGARELATQYGDGMITLRELWEHTKEFAEVSGNPSAYNASEAASQFAMQEEFLRGEATGYVSVLSHPDGVRYVQVWDRSESGTITSRQLDLYAVTGRDFSVQEAAVLIERVKDYHDAGSSGTQYHGDYARFTIRQGRVSHADVRTIAIAQVVGEEYLSPSRTETHAAYRSIDVLTGGASARIQENADIASADDPGTGGRKQSSVVVSHDIPGRRRQRRTLKAGVGSGAESVAGPATDGRYPEYAAYSAPTVPLEDIAETIAIAVRVARYIPVLPVILPDIMHTSASGKMIRGAAGSGIPSGRPDVRTTPGRHRPEIQGGTEGRVNFVILAFLSFFVSGDTGVSMKSEPRERFIGSMSDEKTPEGQPGDDRAGLSEKSLFRTLALLVAVFFSGKHAVYDSDSPTHDMRNPFSSAVGRDSGNFLPFAPLVQGASHDTQFFLEPEWDGGFLPHFEHIMLALILFRVLRPATPAVHADSAESESGFSSARGGEQERIQIFLLLSIIRHLALLRESGMGPLSGSAGSRTRPRGQSPVSLITLLSHPPVRTVIFLSACA